MLRNFHMRTFLGEVSVQIFGPLYFIYLFIGHTMILVPWPGIEPAPLAEEVWSPNHWTAREFPCLFLIGVFVFLLLSFKNSLCILDTGPLSVFYKI